MMMSSSDSNRNERPWHGGPGGRIPRRAREEQKAFLLNNGDALRAVRGVSECVTIH